MFDVGQRTIYLTRHGSHAYGLSTPMSDLDIKGVCIEPKAYHYGYVQNFEQFERSTPNDEVIYSLKKFVKLASNANPNIIEVLFSDESDHLKVDKFGQLLLDHRNEFISKKAMFTFSGYAISQLKRIETHRRWLLKPPTHNPTRQEFDLQELPIIPKDQLAASLSMISKKLEQWHFEDMSDFTLDQRILIQSILSEILNEISITSNEKWLSAGRSVGMNENFLLYLDKERRFKTAQNDWKSFQDWKNKRNPARAETEMKFGYDVKHGMHLIRLMRMCKEILSGQGVIVKRPDREELLQIRNGQWSYDKIIENAKELQLECTELYKTTKLQQLPDYSKLDNLIIQMTENYVSLYG